MSVLITTLITFILSIGLAILVPLLPAGLALISFTGAFLIWLTPTIFSGTL